MTRKHKLLILVLITFGATLMYWSRPHSQSNYTKAEKPATQRSIASHPNVSTPQSSPAPTLPTVKDFHHNEPVWETQFKQTLIAQAGQNPPEITLKKLETITLHQYGITLKADSYLVTLKQDQKTLSTFKAIVDRNTGKILQSWDQPIFEDFHRKDQFAIKIDPRYQQ